MSTVLTNALKLDPIKKISLIDDLLDSLNKEKPTQTKIEKEWTKEADSRIQAYKHGKLETISEEEFFNIDK
jgi:putative addiction module component (TIGR02574 family)